MSLPVLSASGSRRWLACALAAQLPQEEGVPHPSALVGTRFHKLVETAVAARQWVDLEPLDEHFAPALRATLEWFNAQASDAVEILAEQAYELAPLGGYVNEPDRREPKWRDVMSCSRIDLAGHRAYPNREGRIYGTADVVVLGKGIAHVIDWKTGKKSDDHEAQLKTLALMVADAEHVNHVRATAVYVNLQTAKVSEQTWLFDSFDLHLHAGAIVSLAHKLLSKELAEPQPGKHCFFCTAIGCPEKLRTTR